MTHKKKKSEGMFGFEVRQGGLGTSPVGWTFFVKDQEKKMKFEIFV
jgi:hypothetical protein